MTEYFPPWERSLLLSGWFGSGYKPQCLQHLTCNVQGHQSRRAQVSLFVSTSHKALFLEILLYVHQGLLSLCLRLSKWRCGPLPFSGYQCSEETLNLGVKANPSPH